MDAELNFFATSHGKGPRDELGGTGKRLAARASLQRQWGSYQIDVFSYRCDEHRQKF